MKTIYESYDKVQFTSKRKCLEYERMDRNLSDVYCEIMFGLPNNKELSYSNYLVVMQKLKKITVAMKKLEPYLRNHKDAKLKIYENQNVKVTP